MIISSHHFHKKCIYVLNKPHPFFSYSNISIILTILWYYICAFIRTCWESVSVSRMQDLLYSKLIQLTGLPKWGRAQLADSVGKKLWFSITTIYPISFVNIFWLISANKCFQKNIGSGTAQKCAKLVSHNIRVGGKGPPLQKCAKLVLHTFGGGPPPSKVCETPS